MWKTCCLIIVCLFILGESSAEAENPAVDLRCDPKEQEVESGENLTIHCVLDSTRLLNTWICEVKDTWYKCLCGGQECTCDLTIGSYSNGNQNVSVMISNATVSGTYNVAVQHNCDGEENDSININIITQANISRQVSPETSTLVNIVMGPVAVVFVVVVVIVAAVTVWIRRRRLSSSKALQSNLQAPEIEYQQATQQV